MDFIQEIKIKNFRSIKTIQRNLAPTHLNIFVGKNDQGKSNILRALNLFFNNQTEAGKPFRFEDDYCFKAPTGRGSRIEVKVELLINPPSHRFTQHDPVVWTKIWKKDGSIRETRKHLDGSLLSDRNNVSQWLNKLTYRYVPAVKGQEYFSNLMGELHDVLNTIHADVFIEQGQGFISGIQEIMEEITNDLDKQLGIPNTIQVPSDFKSLFSNLDFGTQKDGFTYHLKQRGDGIKVRHIPIILKYMSMQEKNISKPGYVKPDTIWGFEEPENNLEFEYAFQTAEALKAYSEDIQIFLTTHSPAFYSLSSNEGDVKTNYVSLNPDGCTEIKPISKNDTEEIHKNMGFLPLITPYLEEIYEKNKQVEQLLAKIEEIKEDASCFILTEDDDQKPLIKLLENNAFDFDDSEIISYSGADSFHGAIVLADYIKSKKPDSFILIHRDRDYLSDDDLNKCRRKCENKGFHFITTTGTDIESFFINRDHILSLYPMLESDTVEQLIIEATEETEDDSIKRLANQSILENRPKNNDIYGEVKKYEELYKSDPERYRYGKGVYGRLVAKIQKEIGENPTLYQYTEHVQFDELTSIANQIWPRN